MPYTIRKVGKCYQVRSPNGVRAKCTSKLKAQKQVRYLNMIEHGDAKSKRRRRK